MFGMDEFTQVVIDRSKLKYILIAFVVIVLIHFLATFNSLWAIFAAGAFTSNILTTILVMLLAILYLILTGAGIFALVQVMNPSSDIGFQNITCSKTGAMSIGCTLA